MKKKARQAGTRATDMLRRAAARPKAIFTPFRLVIIAIIGVIATTIFFGWRAQNLETALETIRDASEQGALFLSQRDFPAAETAFQKALESIDVLSRAGQDHPKAAFVLQMFNESHAATNLSERSLFNIVRDAQRELDKGRSRWDDFLSHGDAGQWIIMETEAQIPPGNREQNGTTFAYSMPFGGKQVLVTTDRRVFENLSLEQGPKRVVFAAQLESCRLADPGGRKWIITLRTDTAFLWSSFENLQGVGFVFDDKAAEQQVQRLLTEQSSLMEISP